MRHPLVTIVVALFPLIGGCGRSSVPPAADLEKFKDYYADEVYLTERTRLEGGDTTILNPRLDSLRSRFSISTGKRDTLLGYLQDSLPRWEAFLTDVLQRLEERSGAPDSTGTGRVRTAGKVGAR
jgi:hypothetical protein